MNFTPTRDFKPAVGLRSAHAQTVYGAYARKVGLLQVRRERWELPDGDFLDIDCMPGAIRAPLIVVLHGLEGSSRAGYVRALLRRAHESDWAAIAVNFRSCSGQLNRLARFYYAGDTGDLDFVVRQLRLQKPGTPLFCVGFSFGGNILLNYLAEQGEASCVDAAVAISVPFDLSRCVRQLDSGSGMQSVYRARFLKSLKKKALAKARRFPHVIDPRVRNVDTIEEYDDVLTAPLHGFGSAADYYDRCSSVHRIREIRTPTLLISSADDPLVPYEDHSVDNPFLSNLVTEYGGHVAFVEGSPWLPRFWAEEQILSFLAQRQAPNLR